MARACCSLRGPASRRSKNALRRYLVWRYNCRGARPIALTCNAAMASCEFNSLGNHQPSPAPFARQLPPRARTCQVRPMHRCTLTARFAPPTSRRAASQHSPGQMTSRGRPVSRMHAVERYREHTYKDIEVGQHAFDSVLRATLRGIPATTKDALAVPPLFDHLYARGRHGRAGVCSLAATRLMAIHGVYVTHGTLCETARKAGIPVVVFGVPYHRGRSGSHTAIHIIEHWSTQSHHAWENRCANCGRE